MRQTKPFIVEIKPTRKSKTSARKPSIWGDLDLSQDQDAAAAAPTNELAAVPDGASD